MQLEYCRGFHYIFFFLVIPSTPYSAVWNFGKQTNTNRLKKKNDRGEENTIRWYILIFFFFLLFTRETKKKN